MDLKPFPSLMISSSILPVGSLLESLIQISNEITSIEKLPSIQIKNISKMIRRIKLLSSLFEDLQETKILLPPSCILCLSELLSVIRKAKFLILECKNGSCIWGLIRTEFLSSQFYVLVKEMGRALDILPISLLNLMVDTKEQVELLHKQVKRVDLVIDQKEVGKKDKILQIMAWNNEKNKKNKGFLDFDQVKEVFLSIGLNNSLDFDDEILKLEAEAKNQAGTGGIIVISNINNLKSLLKYSKSMIFCDINEKILEHSPDVSSSSSSSSSLSSSSNSILPSIPDEFRCPISLDLMKDPVIVASGHTYDRNSIAQWINAGHQKCPKSGQMLIHMALIPNYALKSLVHQWCEDNNIPLLVENYSSELEHSNKNSSNEKAVDHISATKAVSDAVKMTAEFLVGKLAMGSLEIQRQAAYELRLLAKTGMDNRRIIAEAGAIPFLVTLLSSKDPRIQENAVTALLNLSIYDNNKILIMDAGAIDNIVTVLESGRTMEARENAAATIFSLSMRNDCKKTIGTRPRAIPALVRLLNEGTTSGKKDAANALFNLALYTANKSILVISGAIPLLIELLMDEKAGVTDDALAVLSLLLGCSQGLKEISENRFLVSVLIDLLRFGSVKGKENSVTILLGLCKNGGEEVAKRLLINPRSIPSLQSLSADGSLKARRKADALLRFLNRCCSQAYNPVR